MQTPRVTTLRQGRTQAALIAAALCAVTLYVPAAFATESPARPAAANAAAKKPGTAKPVIGDILEGTNIRKKPGNGANATKPNANQGKGQRRIESPRDSASGLATGK
jgi:hypothetical protein